MKRERQTTSDLVQALEALRPRLRPYIDYIRFPYYRNLLTNTIIDFEFPFTVFVGKNGTSKSSTLQALYGCPEGKSVGDYWFATSVDKVEDKRNDLEHSFVYGYSDGSKNVEVLKLRRNRKGNPEYWEPEAPLAKYGMEPSGPRSKPVKKDVIYLDFRAELSAFARFFHSPDEHRLSLLDKMKKARDAAAGRASVRARRYSKQDYIRSRAKVVRKLLDGVLQLAFAPSGSKPKPKNKPVESLSAKNIKTLNWILDKNYRAGRILEHGLYGNHWGKTVVFETPNDIGKEYSEAFAGSGEIALTILIHALEKAPDNSLVLLDEPELSLHPIAQERLKQFLLECSLQRKLQVVVSTHSPAFVSGLPPAAIKVFKQQPDGLVAVHTGYTPEEAFREIATPTGQRLLLVEDRRAAILLACGFQQTGSHALEVVSIQPSPGGVSQIYFDIGVHSRSATNCVVVLDGDQKPLKSEDPGKLATSASEEELRAVVGRQTAGNDVNGPALRWVGATERERCDHMRSYLKFLYERVHYLPGLTPEDAVWDDDFARRTLEYHSVDPAYLSTLQGERNHKRRFELMEEKINGAVNAETLYREFVTSFAKQDAKLNGPLSRLVSRLRQV